MQPYSSPLQLTFVIPASFSCSDGKFSPFQQNSQLSAALSEGMGGGDHQRCGRNTFGYVFLFSQPSAGCCVEQQIKDDPSLTLYCFKQSKFRHAIKKLTPKYDLLDVEPFTFQ